MMAVEVVQVVVDVKVDVVVVVTFNRVKVVKERLLLATRNRSWSLGATVAVAKTDKTAKMSEQKSSKRILEIVVKLLLCWQKDRVQKTVRCLFV